MTRTRENAIQSYVTDMLALEEHIEKAVRAQIADFEKEYPATVEDLRGIHRHLESHIATLKDLAEKQGGAAHAVGDAIKRAGSIVAGLGAAAIDLVRNEKIAKDLRDDYTALSLASVGYLMLLTTARALERDDIASAAEQHLRDYADDIMTLNNTVPKTVIQVLEEDGLNPRMDVLHSVQSTLQAAWR